MSVVFNTDDCLQWASWVIAYISLSEAFKQAASDSVMHKYLLG